MDPFDFLGIPLFQATLRPLRPIYRSGIPDLTVALTVGGKTAASGPVPFTAVLAALDWLTRQPPRRGELVTLVAGGYQAYAGETDPATYQAVIDRLELRR